MEPERGFKLFHVKRAKCSSGRKSITKTLENVVNQGTNKCDGAKKLTTRKYS